LIGMLCAVSFIAIQSTKTKDLQKKLDSQPKMEPQQQPQQQQPKRTEPLSELLR